MRTFSKRAALTAALTSLWSLQALAADLPYLDDRSDAAAVVRSLYNAVSRKEYARAWDYFGEAKPAKDFAEFAKGYEKTERVEIETGAVSSDGAAGSVFYNIPVAIRAIDKDGTEKVFAGCYTARQVNGSVQEPPFTPIQLEKGVLKPADGNLTDALPKQCGDAPPTEIDAVLDLATRPSATLPVKVTRRSRATRFPTTTNRTPPTRRPAKPGCSASSARWAPITRPMSIISGTRPTG
jgi:hypothetical protein